MTDAENQVRLKARDDTDFLNSLVRNPRSAILTETGVELSDAELIIFNDEIRKCIVGADTRDHALTNEELQWIVAGRCVWRAGEATPQCDHRT